MVIKKIDIFHFQSVVEQVENGGVIESDNRIDIALDEQRIAQLHIKGDTLERLRSKRMAGKESGQKG